MKLRKLEDFRRAFKKLQRYGILLESDHKLPSIAGLIAGEPIHGSWWGHPKGRAIFRVTRLLAAHHDVLVTKLISGKVTYVYRKLWPAIFTIASSREPWQLHGLSRQAQSLLSQVDQEGILQTDKLPRVVKSKAIGVIVNELEKKLIIHSAEFHTETGAHAKFLESWDHWANRIGFFKKIPMEKAKEQLENLLEKLNKKYKAAATLPWIKMQRRSKKL
jgi:hypothetical protein